MNKRRVLLSPHFDDAVLSAWSKISFGTIIVTVCGGIPDQLTTVSSADKKCGFDSAAFAAITRRKEDQRVCERIGVSYRHLDFLDNPYDRNKDIKVIKKQLDKAVGEADELYAPIGIGAHPDHIAVRDAALELFRDKDIELYLYADYPYAAERNTDKKEYDWDKTIHCIRAVLDNAERVDLEREQLLKKIDTFRLYTSQINVLKSHYPGLLDCPGILGAESFWRVRL
ncbi:PIG-L deacetylase family protein [Ruminococcus flavefaciens]|uniref:N-acetylglucosaminyl deacetylase, LmbE family n=1 Tax=Ruminococcus flavefaciens TaxID=1265 RepID=A0A1M7GCF5_RUMFL|nr:PIG-L family deacetylase [Ruminococcus flavefaciens]SHM14072.1 N-acetylglucosaminyl deacetylase, LmbE family [Ruminococcus flavefaciens]